MTQEGQFTYGGEAVPGTTYPSGVITTGDTVWTRLAQGLTVSFTNTISGPDLADLSGAMRLDVSVTAADGWTATFASSRRRGDGGPDRDRQRGRRHPGRAAAAGRPLRRDRHPRRAGDAHRHPRGPDARHRPGAPVHGRIPRSPGLHPGRHLAPTRGGPDQRPRPHLGDSGGVRGGGAAHLPPARSHGAARDRAQRCRHRPGSGARRPRRGCVDRPVGPRWCGRPVPGQARRPDRPRRRVHAGPRRHRRLRRRVPAPGRRAVRHRRPAPRRARRGRLRRPRPGRDLPPRRPRPPGPPAREAAGADPDAGGGARAGSARRGPDGTAADGRHRADVGVQRPLERGASRSPRPDDVVDGLPTP